MILRALVFIVGAAVMASPGSGQAATPAVPDSVRTLRSRTALMSDLRNFMTAQEAYFSDHLRYAGRMAEIASAYHPSDGVTVIVLSGAATSHTAIAIHRDSPDLVCAIAIGANVRNPLGDGPEGAVMCRLPDGSVYTRPTPGRLAPGAASR